MSKQLVEFKSVNTAEDIEILEILGKSTKDVFIKVEETGDILFNGVNLSKQYNISEDKVIKDIVKEEDKLVISFTDDSEDKIIDISKHLNDVKKGYELQNILATDFINIKDQYQSVDGKDNIEIKSTKPISDYKLHIKGCEKTISDKYPKGSFLVRTHPTSEFKVETNYKNSGVAYFNNKEVKIEGTTTIDLGEKKEHDILFVITEGDGFSLKNIDNPHIKHISYIPNSEDVIKAFSYIGNKDVIFEIAGKPKIIGKDAFNRCSGFTGDLIIPEGVTSIGENAFNSCSGFTGDLIIPESVTSIGENAFIGCKGFTSLKLPESLTSIGYDVFRNCSGFTGDLIIPENVTSIESGAFYDCRGFTSLKLPESLTSIGEWAFNFCRGFTGDLIIPESVTSIGENAFIGCKGFTSLKLPKSLTSIGNGTFYDCSGFTGELKLPESLTSIGNNVFLGCSGFTGDLIIPENVTSIESGAFNGCSRFTGDLILPEGLKSIGAYAFNSCSGLSRIYVCEDTKLEDYWNNGTTAEVIEYKKGETPWITDEK